ncbi:helix-turn-helix domain-containing protein [Marinobacter alexandrii]|uniref:helix-turn-helix domain-containing protein n=1 Tax=Marinobacter alexandrii TaxID=2570351 RepID=UPI0011096D85|nr:helix-turn-helix domain-containing protein [Marinobacter alexandrii]
MKPRFILTEEHVFLMRAVRAQGGNLGQAAKEIGITRDTLSKAVLDSPYRDEIYQMYPKMVQGRQTGGKPKRDCEMQHITLEELQAEPPVVDTSLLTVRAAIISWRKAA